MLQPYAGADRPERELDPALPVSPEHRQIGMLEDENARLRETVKRLESVLHCVARVLRPYG